VLAERFAAREAANALQWNRTALRTLRAKALAQAHARTPLLLLRVTLARRHRGAGAANWGAGHIHFAIMASSDEEAAQLQVEALVVGLVREYLYRRGMKDVLRVFDSETVRQLAVVPLTTRIRPHQT
jgi:hypothetical protein